MKHPYKVLFSLLILIACLFYNQETKAQIMYAGFDSEETMFHIGLSMSNEYSGSIGYMGEFSVKPNFDELRVLVKAGPQIPLIQERDFKFFLAPLIGYKYKEDAIGDDIFSAHGFIYEGAAGLSLDRMFISYGYGYDTTLEVPYYMFRLGFDLFGD